MVSQVLLCFSYRGRKIQKTIVNVKEGGVESMLELLAIIIVGTSQPALAN